MLSKLLLFGYINLYCLALNHDSLNFHSKKNSRNIYITKMQKIFYLTNYSAFTIFWDNRYNRTCLETSLVRFLRSIIIAIKLSASTNGVQTRPDTMFSQISLIFGIESEGKNVSDNSKRQ